MNIIDKKIEEREDEQDGMIGLFYHWISETQKVLILVAIMFVVFNILT